MSTKKKPISEEFIDLVLDEEQSRPSRDGEAIVTHVTAPADKTWALDESDAAGIPVSGLDDSLEKSEATDQSSSVTGTRVAYGEQRVHHIKHLSQREEALLSSAEANIKRAEHLRLAQQRMIELEDEVERLQRENEELASAGETFRKINDELKAEVGQLQRRLEDQELSHQDEKKLIEERLTATETENAQLHQKVAEMEDRLDSGIQRIRKREKDLEHRLEIARLEGSTLLKSKDELILELKRKLDQAEMELKNFGKKNQEMHQRLREQQEVVRRVVRALRLALTQLESNDDESAA